MIDLLKQIMSQSLERITSQVLYYAPGLLAALFVLLIAFIAARFLQWMILKIFKGIALNRFLKKTGLATSPEMLKTPQLTARSVFWLVLGSGFLVALSCFDSQLTSRIIEKTVFLFPKMLVAAAIIIAGAWLGRYLGRSILVWAVNENVPGPRRLASAVRIFIIFGGVVAAADHLDFAQNVFLSAFILLVGGMVLTAGITLGLSGRDFLKRLQNDNARPEEAEDRPIWKHL